MHIPVLLKEVTDALKLHPDYKYIDCTAGGGGHIKQVIKLNPKTWVLGLDWDQASLSKLQKEFSESGLDSQVTLVHSNYKDLKQVAAANKFLPADGILIDLGFSSLQIDDAERGFSFRESGPLDMRFDQSQKITAAQILNSYPETKITQILKQYAEEIFANKIAHAIVRERQVSPFARTDQVLAVIRGSLPKPVRHKAEDVARRVFQALRIEVNQELENLKVFLPQAIDVLKPGGRLAVIAFHSLEDRIVKRFFQEETKDCVCPPEFPVCVCGKTSRLRILTRKPITATEEEIKSNPRSKPAKLRVIEKI